MMLNDEYTPILPLNEVSYKIDADTHVFRQKLYPKVKEAMDKPSTKTAYKKLLNEFMSIRSQDLYDSIPCSRIVCSEGEMDKLFDVLHIKKSDVSQYISETYYGHISNFKPAVAKHEFSITQTMIIRYFQETKQNKEAELAMLYLAFSGKFYPSIHYGSYPTVVPARHVMEYVVNNCLSNKFDLVTKGSVIGAIKSVSGTMLNSYRDRLKRCEDEDVVYFIEQLHSRIRSFMKNIATEYYKVYEDKDSYFAYSSDSYDPDDYHLADSDTLKISRITEKTINYITSTGVSYQVCKACSDVNITPNECRNVIESIVNNPSNIQEIKELISLILAIYFSTGERDVTDIKFITSTVAPKPNARQKELIRTKEIIENWLTESGTAYMKRKSRLATKNSYNKAVLMYFTLTIHNANR